MPPHHLYSPALILLRTEINLEPPPWRKFQHWLLAESFLTEKLQRKGILHQKLPFGAIPPFITIGHSSRLYAEQASGVPQPMNMEPPCCENATLSREFIMSHAKLDVKHGKASLKFVGKDSYKPEMIAFRWVG